MNISRTETAKRLLATDSLYVDLMRIQERQIEMLERLLSEDRAPRT